MAGVSLVHVVLPCDVCNFIWDVLTFVGRLRQEYNGKIADVWSVGVSLYVLLTGTFPFKRPEDSKANNVRC